MATIEAAVAYLDGDSPSAKITIIEAFDRQVGKVPIRIHYIGDSGHSRIALLDPVVRDVNRTDCWTVHIEAPIEGIEVFHDYTLTAIGGQVLDKDC